MAKHGNRSVSSGCGSADVLKALGVNIELSSEDVAACVDEVGFGFLYAPLLHPAMKHAIGPRREMGVRTIFNILGPLTNPAQAQAQLTEIQALNRRLSGQAWADFLAEQQIVPAVTVDFDAGATTPNAAWTAGLDAAARAGAVFDEADDDRRVLAVLAFLREHQE